ncbi:tripartite motif-containing protein 5-like [Saccostrea echinata]|uniref:tripartite motif-containing protein 5-like n=1 Tax=Saccostrea echinata TaxID=191078 RepID=UPI002A7FE4C5|nr:tripartite motif-containing protein 5-like [Saccostrea echinata]
MATSDSPQHKGDISTCSVCFERFKNPRYLPCLHSFCHSCLESYIISACISKDSPVGFRCPLCREFVAAPGTFSSPEKWAKQLPLNESLIKYLKNENVVEDHNMCEACNRAQEDQPASFWCKTCMEFLCDMCTKYHRKNMMTQEHRLAPLNEVKSSGSAMIAENVCVKHKGEIMMFCFDHQEACCTTCVSFEHRKCQKVESIDKCLTALQEDNAIEKLMTEIDKLSLKLENIAKEEESNISQIDLQSNEILRTIEQIQQEIVEHMELLKNSHAGELSKITKERKDKLNSSLDSIMEKKLYMEHCKQVISRVKENGSDLAFVTKYYEVKRKIDEIKKTNINKISFDIQEKISPKVKEMKTISKLSELSVFQKSCSMEFGFDVTTAKMTLEAEFTVENGWIYGGSFLPSGGILLADYPNFRFIYLDCIGKNILQGKLVGPKPRDIIVQGSDILIALEGLNALQKVSVGKFSLGSTIPTGEACLGIAKFQENIYVTRPTSIIKLDKQGNILKTYPTRKWTYSVTVTDIGNIIHCHYGGNSVSAMRDDGNTLWVYKHPKLIGPVCVSVDFLDNIYVAGEQSNNVHILSPKGRLLRIIPDIPKPFCIKFKEGSLTFFVVTNGNCVKVYEFKSK